MYISKAKLVVAFLIIFCILYKYNISDIMDKDINTFGKRITTNKNEELPDYVDDYETIRFSNIYLNNFLNLLQSDVNTDVSKYIEESYYKEYIENSKETFINKMKSNIIILDPTYCYHHLEYESKYTNNDGHKVSRFTVSVYKKSYLVSFGYDILQYENNKDANKRMLIDVIEYSPYNFKITFPIETTKDKK